MAKKQTQIPSPVAKKRASSPKDNGKFNKKSVQTSLNHYLKKTSQKLLKQEEDANEEQKEETPQTNGAVENSHPQTTALSATSTPKSIPNSNQFKVQHSKPVVKPKQSISQQQEQLRAKIDAERKKLPVYSAKEHILRLIDENQILVITAETGTGKTTQIPQYIFEHFHAKHGLLEMKRIAITQPRRVAATTIAKRVAQEMNVKLGEQVGYTIRFEDKTQKNTKIKYMTDGMLLRECQLDPLLEKYNVIMLDEAHERTLHTDILFGLMKEICSKRPHDFKLIIMSATLEAQRFAKYYNYCKIVSIAGRQYPVDIYFAAEPQYDYIDAAITTTLQIHLDEPFPGDILVFLTGQDEIESAARILEDKARKLPQESAKLIVHKIFAGLPYEKQLEVFEPTPEGCRKVILATNIAETSITINGIKYVVDSGQVKSRAYNPKTGLEALKVIPVSKASARQRTGRAGREQPGKCYRLFTEESFQNMEDFTAPEIVRVNLSTVVLQMLSMGIKDVVNFDFLEPPSKESLKTAMKDLKILGAIDPQGQLTALGKKMAGFPLDPMYAVCLLRAPEFGCVDEILTIVSMLSVESIFYSPLAQRDQANKMKLKFSSPYGDHLTLLRVYKEFNAIKGGDKDRLEWCTYHFINFKSMQKVMDIRKQLIAYLAAVDIDPTVNCGTELDCVRKCLTSGFFMHSAKKIPRTRQYQTIIASLIVDLHPTSVIRDPLPEYVIFNQMVLTSKEYMRDVTAIDSQWLHEVAPTLISIDAPQPEAEAASKAPTPARASTKIQAKLTAQSFSVLKSI